jgi:transposase
MAVRGLGCPVRFTLTAGQKGDAPQAAELIEGLPAEVVMADTAYDADPLRQAIAAKGAIAVIPNNPSRALKISARQASLRPASSGGVLGYRLSGVAADLKPAAVARGKILVLAVFLNDGRLGGSEERSRFVGPCVGEG